MIEIVKELNIEVSKPNIFQAVVAKQYDMNTRFIKATLTDDTDVIYIPSGPTVKAIINANRPDGQSKGFDGVVNEDGTVTVPLHSWMLQMEGSVICDISIIDTATDDNKKLTTTAFTLLVEKAAYGGEGITNDPQFDVLVSLIETCNGASETAQDALDKSILALEKSASADAKYDACVEATENANNVMHEIQEGGYIESLKELNKGGKFTFWVGTEKEYNALGEDERRANCLYLTEDDHTLETLLSLANRDYVVEQVFDPKCTYRKWDSGLAECWIRLESKKIYNNGIHTPTCEVSYTLPFEFIAYPVCTCSGFQYQVSTSYITLATATPTYVSAHMKFEHNNLETNPCYFNFYVTGRWK